MASRLYQSTAVFDENRIAAAGKAKATVGAQPRRALRNITNAVKPTVSNALGKDKPVTRRGVGLRRRDTNVPVAVETTTKRTHAAPKSRKQEHQPELDDVMDMDLEELDELGNVAAQPLSSQASSSSAQAAPVIDPVDVGDMDNELFVGEYVMDIMEYLKSTETKYVADAHYMQNQPDLSPKMREILVDWLIEVHAKFKLRPETLYLCVNLIDRFLSVREVLRSKLQLVGITALLLASKYEEIWAPEVRDLLYMSDNAYKREEILHMEGTMLAALHFHLTVPSIYRFTERWVKVAGGDERLFFLSCFLAESTLQKMDFMTYKNSHIAAAAVYLANRLSNQVPWNATLQNHTGYSESDLLDCVAKIYALIQEEKPKYKGVRRKYANPKFLSVARMAPGNLQF